MLSLIKSKAPRETTFIISLSILSLFFCRKKKAPNINETNAPNNSKEIAVDLISNITSIINEKLYNMLFFVSYKHFYN